MWLVVELDLFPTARDGGAYCGIVREVKSSCVMFSIGLPQCRFRIQRNVSQEDSTIDSIALTYSHNDDINVIVKNGSP
jgi:hypothetical protein